ncbi:MAG: hypothetical protein V4726_25125 [Verrucomicrobiota bacterium]
MKHRHCSTPLFSISICPRPVPGSLSLPFLAGALALLSASAAKANPCSYGEAFDFTNVTAGAASNVGLMAFDIDRTPNVTCTVTATGGGNLPTGVIGNTTSGGQIEDRNLYFPVFTTTTAPEPSYNHSLFINDNGGGNPNQTPLTFTFSKAMRNLALSIRRGDNKIYTFTDGETNLPLEITYRSTSSFASPPSTTNGANSDFWKQVSTNSVAIGALTQGTIAFRTPVKIIKMTHVRAGTTLASGTDINAGGQDTTIIFTQFCDQPGVVDSCTNPRFADWTTPASAAATTVNGNMIDETGKFITVTYAGGLADTGLTGSGAFTGGPTGATQGLYVFPVRPAQETVHTSNTNTSLSPAVLTWTFGESVHNPMLMLVGTTGGSSKATLKFYKKDGITPLPFILRAPLTSEKSRQVDQNELYAPSTYNSQLQFVGDTTGIVLKVSGGDNPFVANATVIMGCNGVMTATNTIDGDTDGDGVPNLTDKCPNTPAGAVVGSDGCPLPTDLSVVKTASVTKITPGVPFTYTITVTNTGAEANNVKASDIIPAGLTINSVTASDSGSVTQNGQTVEALWPIVANGGVRTLTINVTKP